VSWYRRAAEAGHAAAQFNLGVCYANGDGVAKDAEQAVLWYRRAAEAGHTDAQFNLGVLLLSMVTGLPRMQSRPCRGTAVQLRRATQMLSSTWACATPMVTVLPRMQSRQYRGTAVQLRRATQMLSSTWAHCYSNGDGVAKDAEQAVSWYRRAAEAGHAVAQYNVGVCYAQWRRCCQGCRACNVRGTGCSAEAGHPDAQLHLGVCYYHGNGVAKDAEEAVFVVPPRSRGGPRSCSI